MQQYVGQTNDPVEIRWRGHIASAKRFIKYRDQPDKIENIYHSLLYRTIAKYGIETFSIQVLEDGIYDQDLLDETEKQYIAELNTKHPHGLNLLSGGGSNSRHSEITIQIMRRKKQETALLNRNAILEDLPPLTTYKNDELGERILVNKHPLCKSRTFSVKTYGSIEAVKDAVKAFIAEIELTGIPYEPAKGGEDLNKYPGLNITPSGYRVNKVHKGTTYDKRFERKDRTNAQNKQAAIDWYISLLIRLNLPIPN